MCNVKRDNITKSNDYAKRKRNTNEYNIKHNALLVIDINDSFLVERFRTQVIIDKAIYICATIANFSVQKQKILSSIQIGCMCKLFKRVHGNILGMNTFILLNTICLDL